MERKDIIEMSTKEVKRLRIIQNAMEKIITQNKASKLIGITERQIRRIIKRVREDGPIGIVSKARGKPGNRRVNPKLKERIKNMYKRKYEGFGPTLASEKMEEIDKIKVNHDRLRKWLLEDSKKYEWQRKRKDKRQWRERKECYGEMIQGDGSHHDWLEGRRGKMVLMGYIDDATSEVFARFYEYEGTMPALDCFYRYTRKRGLPLSVYLDMHTTYRSNKKLTIEEELMGKIYLSEFERAMKELDVRVIHAGSPQAKGRIERLFGTFQDRLVKELRLAKINTMEDANKFLEGCLPKYNKRFSRPAKNPANLHREAPKKQILDSILCIKAERNVRNDGVVQYKNHYYLIDNKYKEIIKKVTIEERIDGSIWIKHKDKYLKYKEIEKSLMARPVEKRKPVQQPKKVYMPSNDHPWKQYYRINMEIRKNKNIGEKDKKSLLTRI